MASVMKIVTGCETHVDSKGNKVVEPVYNGTGGTVAGTICVVKK